MKFTVEETNLMCCFDTSSRGKLIAEMKTLPLIDLDGEMAELIHNTVLKLESMTDAEFDAFYIVPDEMLDD